MQATATDIVPRKAKKLSTTVDHAAGASVPALFQPTRAQRDYLQAAIENPWEQHNVRRLAQIAGVSDKIAYHWRKDPAFRAWWSEMLLQAARHWAGPAAFELRRLIEDVTTPSAVKVRAVQAFLKAVGMGEQAHQKAHLFTELLRQFRGSQVAAEMKLAADGEQVAMEIRAVSAGRQQSASEGDARERSATADNEPYAEPEPVPGESPRRHPDAVQVSFGPEQAAEAIRSLRQRLTAEHQAETEKLIRRELAEIDAGRDPRQPTASRLAPPAVVRACVRQRRGEGVVGITESGAQSQSAPPSLSAGESRPPRLKDDPP